MIAVENDYENVMYEQPSHSHVYENQLKLLYLFHNNRSNNIPIDPETIEATTLHEPEKEQVLCSSTNHI